MRSASAWRIAWAMAFRLGLVKRMLNVATLNVAGFVVGPVAGLVAGFALVVGLIGAGVNAILNFAPLVLRVPAHVVLSSVNLAIELENLSYFRSLAES